MYLAAGVYLSEAPDQPRPAPLLHIVWIVNTYPTGKGGGGKGGWWTSEKVRRAL